ncbi:Fe-only nitrogenase accessory protein AnfO [Rhodospirillum rubrum]|uniref:Fe-only nitrogenase accessory protein AnfO n=1 Tax=Rhodospirillum rubrum TaxID=1085 RepID=UPI001906C4EA|nr:Fe-only nitrogenase accessory protein AnfO [Rhodospirillum rubrum]MBK1662936.1 Fe-only nitrogenase accessory protein AnfO [Rhodospirillum rubrum]MBK1675223.1 Fe-only nitrogenase accessory protein AnfO [Rhodospirillum rubrum]
MQIAAFVNDQGQVAGFFDKGSVRLFEGSAGAWTLKTDILVDRQEATGLSAVKDALNSIVAHLDETAVFLAKDTRGLAYALLDDMGYRVWKSEGALSDQLDLVARKEQALAKEAPKAAAPGCSSGGCASGRAKKVECAAAPPPPPPPPPEDLGNGRYRLDLGAILAGDTRLNARVALLPVLQEKAFISLEILCDHLPRWFDQELAAVGLRADPPHPRENGPGLRVIVFAPAETAPASGEPS